MLKRLELVGFKSFADKTRFDFAPGVTGVVGPNGSGKSNVVDAVRWILGEQSAKSLRGGEMADVIFNGSSSRKSLGMAEVTVAFDNARRLLSVDADEVQLTRRVYRDGTGEYLINGQMSRLKDIKDILLGSGAGSGGYTIIAQGRVDELLQASTKDRREIFDEAAGISRFKARKNETLRKLASVELNLTRSKDRLDTLDGQLRMLRMQAAKAQKYKEHSDRLRELRVGLSTREFRALTVALVTEQEALASLKVEVSGATTEAEQLEQRAKELDWSVSRGEEALRHHEAKLSDARQQITGFEGTLKHERVTEQSLEAELLKVGRQRADLGYRLKVIEADAARAAIEGATAESRLAEEKLHADEVNAALTATVAQLAELDREQSESLLQQMELVRESASSKSTAEATLAQVTRLQKEYTRKLADREHKSAQRATLAHALDGLSQADADVQARLNAANEQLDEQTANRDELTDQLADVQTRLEGFRVRQGDLRGRIDVLEGLERSFEGLGAGVQQVLQRIKGEEPADPGAVLHPSSALVIGLVADLLTVPREVAPLVELALGDTAQRFVVRSPEVVDAVAAAVGDVTGRVGFVPLGEPTPPSPLPEGKGEQEFGSDLSPPSFLGKGAGGLGSAFNPSPTPPLNGEGLTPPGSSLANFVSCDHPSCAALPAQLLGRVLLADTLADARWLAAVHPAHRIITRTGELLEPDGTLTIGPLKAESGLVSRKSELRELREQFRATSELITDTEIELADLRRQAESAEGVIEAVEAEIALLSDEAGDLLQRIARQRQQVENLDAEIDLNCGESRLLEQQVQECEAAWTAARMAAEEAEHAATQLTARLAEVKQALAAGAQERSAREQDHTAAQVALSRAAADRERVRERLAQIEADLRKRKIEAVDLSAADRNARGRLADCTLSALRASSGQAEAYREKESRERLVAELGEKTATDRTARERVRDRLHELRHGWQEKQSAAHARELSVHDLSARRDAVALRIREDYGIELQQITDEPHELAPDPSAAPSEEGAEAPAPDLLNAQQEIDELKRKLARLGSVNMEALEELTRVEGEFNSLQAQHDDLNAARQSLQQIMDEINGNSRSLFTDTLTAVRGYFQELFRKLFGGGQADIVLEDESDVLESGIEITARPPGKELRSLSLLSGGEKTLTAVALLLAIFRNKPSPFCILDEVDAALDEANTQRLAGVLREFLDRSQFIVITHKKRTMAAADRLWGVTMQESGISRLLPMRFEDWTDEEESTTGAAA
ncbi:chromosome segregation protein smc : Chromosome partition protein Smc OS=Rhodopirellula sallentina SM41 GN=smc PE=3 SV=1: SMC_N: SMC_hinge [Gemmata massiliana]|uniref:Chromosome partition protein Smc n=1 Tax=Gemmata massiliana TaxID=1210884 RepID=A0A6P2DIC9_9BACT|nr:AAA family ATPase [Gemmata massiliana]VTS01980.1 chromosome segregation protein smc : Chromosome partition protein Smc OS=Rhodopirellula sallentina SM41 GN=smc PE=3 SV=1: SMC_N: SMC_hinge [Gemmata massiliana]